LDENDRTDYINERGAAILGYTPEEMLGRPVTDFILPEFVEYLLEKLAEGRKGKESVLEHRMRRKDGSVIWTSGSIRPLFDEHGNYEGGLGVFTDITERKRAEEALQRSEQMLKIVIDNFPGVVYWKDRNSAYLGANRESARIAGFADPSEYVGKTDYDLPWAKTEADAYRADDRQVMESGQVKLHVIEPQLRADGSIGWLDTSKVPLRDSEGKVIGVLGTSMDITDRKRAEEALIDTQNRFYIAKDAAEIGIHEWNLESDSLIWDHRVRELWGVGQDEPITYETLMNGLHPDDRAVRQQAVDRAMDPNRDGKYHAEYRVVNKSDHRIRWVRATGKVFFRDRNPIRLIGTVEDITHRKRAEEELYHSQQMLKLVLNSVPDRVFWKDRDFNYLGCNQNTARDAGLEDPRDIVGKNDYELAWRDSADSYREDDRQVMESGIPKFNYEERQIQSDGSCLWLKTNKVPLRDLEGKVIGVLGTYEDITEEKRNEENLARSNAELQQFAYVASHDLQEPLRMVMSYLALLNKKYGEDLPMQAKLYLSFAVEGAERMRQLINDLLDYSRVEIKGQEFTSVDMDRVIRSVVDDLHMAMRESGAEVVVDPLPIVQADETQMTQLLTNIVSNAIKYRGADPPRIRVFARSQVNDFVFAVEDNGIGIDPQYHDRLFQMFQRLHTKDEYPGTGIGLAISKKIVDRHGGKIWVESEGGKGATFYFSLPKWR
jgi:PAS domain S-box-containing protein